MDIDQRLVRIVLLELGQKCADLFTKFYDGFSFKEQVTGAKEILELTVGHTRASELLRNIENHEKS